MTREDDVGTPVASVLSAHGRLDVAFTNAGLGTEIGPLTELSEATWHAQLGANRTGVLLLLEHEVPAMLDGGGEAIVNTASVLGLVGIGGRAPYVAAKHGAVGGRLSAVAPAVVDTGLFRASLAATEEGIRGATALQLHSVGRLGAAEEIATMVL